MVLSSPYIEQRDSIYLLSGTNTSLDSVVRHYLDGKSVDGIIRSFPALTPEKVCGALAFYLEHREEVDEYLGFDPGETEVMRGGDPEHYRQQATTHRVAALSKTLGVTPAPR